MDETARFAVGASDFGRMIYAARQRFGTFFCLPYFPKQQRLGSSPQKNKERPWLAAVGARMRKFAVKHHADAVPNYDAR